jgi:hypothetical protein
MEHLPLLPLPKDLPKLKTVTGQIMNTYGLRRVAYDFGTVTALFEYLVCDCRGPVLSVPKLLGRGFGTVLEKNHKVLYKDGLECKVHSVGNLLYLKPLWLLPLPPEHTLKTPPLIEKGDIIAPLTQKKESNLIAPLVAASTNCEGR